LSSLPRCSQTSRSPIAELPYAEMTVAPDDAIPPSSRVGFPATFRLRVGPNPSNWTRPGPTWLLRGGTDSIQSRPVVPGSNVWVAREVATGLGERSTVSLAPAPRPSGRDRMLPVSAQLPTIGQPSGKSTPTAMSGGLDAAREAGGAAEAALGPGRCAATARPASDDEAAEGVHDQGCTNTAPPWQLDSIFPGGAWHHRGGTNCLGRSRRTWLAGWAADPGSGG
jgi:hypothetical protein